MWIILLMSFFELCNHLLRAPALKMVSSFLTKLVVLSITGSCSVLAWHCQSEKGVRWLWLMTGFRGTPNFRLRNSHLYLLLYPIFSKLVILLRVPPLLLGIGSLILTPQIICQGIQLYFLISDLLVSILLLPLLMGLAFMLRGRCSPYCFIFN